MANVQENIEKIVEIRNIQKDYEVGGGSISVLKDLSFAVDSGEFVAITGPSGNGKSTLLNMITGIDHPTRGEVLVNGSPVHQMSENQLARWRGENIGIIFQFFQLLPALSLEQNVQMPMEFAGKFSRKERRERARHLLDLVGLADQAQKLPGTVSGGQQQRAAIARALANDPPLLIADEPTGNLDSKTAGAIFNLFLNFADQGKTILMVTHDVNLVNQIPRIVEIRDGIIYCDSISAPDVFTRKPAKAIRVEN
ncbi:MAG: ABC transporter ATP-binding protein [Chloroflexota bacterium]|nr:MAG: ABC transporter ATP-binding protein [Chloroflexota bacterium]